MHAHAYARPRAHMHLCTHKCAYTPTHAYARPRTPKRTYTHTPKRTSKHTPTPPSCFGHDSRRTWRTGGDFSLLADLLSMTVTFETLAYRFIYVTKHIFCPGSQPLALPEFGASRATKGIVSAGQWLARYRAHTWPAS